MSKRLLYPIIVGLVVFIGLTGVALADEATRPTISVASPPTTELVFAPGPDMAAVEAAIADQQLNEYLAGVERDRQAAAARAATPRVAPNYDPGDGSRWDQLAICESGGNWAYPPVAGGFSGGIMFHIGTWRSNGGLEFAPDAYLATREQQIIVAERVLAGSGWGAWPGCSRKYGWL